MNLVNLERLAVALETQKLRFEFNMAVYMTLGGDPVNPHQVIDYTLSRNYPCGSSGCMLGHSAYLVELPLEDETWDQFSLRVFGMESSSPEWNWFFGPNWTGEENTPAAGARRIRWILEGNEMPDRKTRDQMEDGAIPMPWEVQS